MKKNSGSHTIGLTLAKQNYHVLQSIIDRIYQEGYEVEHKTDKYNLDHTYKLNQYSDRGIRLEIRQFCDHAGFVKLILTPGSMLSGEYDPTRLYRGKEKEWENICAVYRDTISFDGLPESLEKYTPSRIDQTWDIPVDSEEELIEWVRVFGKSMRSPRYRRIKFSGEGAAEANCRSAEYCTATKRRGRNGKNHGKHPETAFKAYDKTYECRGRKDLEENILRFELSSTKQALMKKRKLDKQVCLEDFLHAAAKDASDTICKFIKSAMFIDGEILRYNDAMERVSKAPKITEKHKAQMRELIQNCSDCENLYYALQKMDLSDKQRDRLLRQFRELGISPVTLRNDSPLEKLL